MYMYLVECRGHDNISSGVSREQNEHMAGGQDSYLHPFDRSGKLFIISRGMWVLLPPSDRQFPESDSTEWAQAAG